MNSDPLADLRESLRQALAAAERAGVPPPVRATLLVAELAEIVAGAGAAEFEQVLRNVLATLDHAARMARDDRRFESAVVAFVDRWLN